MKQNMFQRKVGESRTINIKKMQMKTIYIKDIALPLFFPGGKSHIWSKSITLIIVQEILEESLCQIISHWLITWVSTN